MARPRTGCRQSETKGLAKAIDVLQDRIQGRFITPAQTLIDVDKGNKQQTFGFAILALDCLVLETIQGFKEGVLNHTGHSTRLFKNFLSNWQPFLACLDTGMVAADKAEEFYKQGRCALHHSGATEMMTVGIRGRKRRGNHFIYSIRNNALIC